MSWRAVYVVEYFGPILFHALIPLLRQYIYIFYPYDLPEGKVPSLKTVQWILLVVFQLHFLKRELETLFLHKFSANTMPARKIFWNSAFYWGLAGLCGGYDIYAPRSFAARDTLGPLDYLGLVMIVFGEVCTFIVHVHLAGLRRPGTTERGIPSCIGSSLVTCPNYMFEVIAWVGVMLMCRSWGVAAFMWVGIAHMRDWSKGKEKTLRQMFPDKYKPHKYTMLPGLI
jgi:very-long-chain enoyl-CoA reductase